MKDRIKQLMESQHMTQQTFADFIGISSASLSSIFTGRTKPTLNTVEAIRSKFSTISLDWLLYGTGNMFNDVSELPSGSVAAASPQVSNDLFSNDTVPTLPFQEANTVPSPTLQTPIQNHPILSTKIINKKERNITEIRIFFDDQTWETFVPKK